MVLTIVRCAIAFLKRSPTLYIAASAVDETPIQYPPAAPQPAKNLSPLHLLSNPPQIGRAVQQECRDRYRMPPSACKNADRRGGEDERLGARPHRGASAAPAPRPQ